MKIILQYYSNVDRARLLFQHGVGLARALSLGPNSVYTWVRDTFEYSSPRKKHVPTLRVSTSLKTEYPAVKNHE